MSWPDALRTHTQLSKNWKLTVFSAASKPDSASAPISLPESQAFLSLPTFLAIQPPFGFMLSVVLNKMDIFFSMRLPLVLFLKKQQTYFY